MAELVSAEKLAAFIADNNTRSWQPGQVDCCIVLASWAMWLGRSDPARHLRGTYDTDEGFRSIIAAAGGVIPVVDRCVANLNGKRLQRPMLGSVGVIGSPSNIHRQYGAIHDGNGWLVRMPRGFGRMTAKTLAAWEI